MTAAPGAHERVTLIATLLNEHTQLAGWLAGLDGQDRRPDEAVIVDGGSSDGTWEALQEWSPSFTKRTYRLPGASIAQGRNYAIEQSTGGIIVVSDAGTVAAPDWLRLLVGALSDERVDVAAGGFHALTTDSWTRALAAATLPDMDEIDGRQFLPSSRSVAVRREWLTAGVLYPEWLDYCEDLVWDLQLQRAGARFAFVPEARVAFAPRSGPRSFWRQYYRYARGDGKAGLWPRRHLLRYVTYAALLAVTLRRRPREHAMAAVLAGAYSAPIARRLWRREGRSGRAGRDLGVLLMLALFARGLGDLAKMAGYPVGLIQRRRHFGALGPRAGWRRITPTGWLWRPE